MKRVPLFEVAMYILFIALSIIVIYENLLSYQEVFYLWAYSIGIAFLIKTLKNRRIHDEMDPG